MAAWAASGKFGGAAFLCACVDPDALETAQDFSRNYFTRAPDSLLNGFIDNRADFPDFSTQLGCQGFVIFDAAGRLAVQGTAPWTQYRDRAFRDLEGRLRQVLDTSAGPANPSLQLGDAEEGRDEEGDPAELLAALEAVPSVHHADMDDEHDRCKDALKCLAKSLSVPALRCVREEFDAHFKHEEGVLREAGFGAPAAGRSCACEDKTAAAKSLDVLAGHIADHRRIIGLADEALDALSKACNTCEGAVPRTVVTKLGKAFAEHATLYDALYVDKLASPAA